MSDALPLRDRTYSAELARFEETTHDHQMKILHDDGLYRQIRFIGPKSSFYYYDLVTWPGHLVIGGDVESYHFARTADMFSWFGSGGINPDYWSEKLQGPTHGDIAKRYSADMARANVLQWFEDASDDLEADEIRELRAELDDQILSHEEFGWDATHAIELMRDFQHNGLSISDPWDYEFTEFTGHYLWCCWAIVKGIERYHAAVPAVVAA